MTPPEPHVAGGSSTAESTNWSGQIASGATFTGVQAAWVVPTVQPTQYSGVSATWIGIDGGPEFPRLHHPDRDHAADTRRSHVVLRLVRALSPTQRCRSDAVSPGDQMEASIIKQHLAGEHLDAHDRRRHLGAGRVRVRSPTPAPVTRPSGSRSSPRSVGAAQPTLANFGSATFTQMAATTSSGSPGLTPVNMIDESGNVIASAGRRRQQLVHRHLRAEPARVLAGRLRRRDLHLRRRPSSTDRPGACTCSGLSSASCPRRTAAAIGSTPPTAGSSATATRSSTAPYPASGSIPPARASPTASTRPSWAWSPPSTTTATSWWPPTAGSSPSVTPTSPGRAPASGAVRAPRWRSCPTTAATATGW